MSSCLSFLSLGCLTFAHLGLFIPFCKCAAQTFLTVGASELWTGIIANMERITYVEQML